MKYRFIGNTGVLVSAVSLGSLTFSPNPKWNIFYDLSQLDVNKLIDFSIDNGINFFDTADIYSDGSAEIKLGIALKTHRKNILLASKVKYRIGNNVNQAGLSRIHILNQIENTLRNLKTDYLDFYFIHGFDNFTNIEDTIITLDLLVKSGKIRYIGVSNLFAWQVVMYYENAKKINCEGIRCLQMHYSLTNRGIEREFWSLFEHYNLGLFIWSPLAGGFLSEKYVNDKISKSESRMNNNDFPPFNKNNALKINKLLKQIAQDKNSTVSQIALSYLLENRYVTSLVLGCRNLYQLKENIKCVDISLKQEEFNLINNLTKLPPEYPNWYINMHSDRLMF
jgi:aryl-alcohol dehydrogenase-like predicted oxidoreductase